MCSSWVVAVDVSLRELCCGGEVVEGGAVGPVTAARSLDGGGWVGVGELGEPGAQQVVVGVGEQQRGVQAGVGDLVAAGAGDAGDEPVRAQAA